MRPGRSLAQWLAHGHEGQQVAAFEAPVSRGSFLSRVLVVWPACCLMSIGSTSEGEREAPGFGRVQLDVTSTIRENHQENPKAPVPFHRDDLELDADVLGDDVSLALYDNGARFYGSTE
jgi:hypothetical protein